MSVLIKGMGMPENCYDCPLIRASYAGDYYCSVGDGIEENLKKVYSNKMSDCQLVEIPTPHGRLLDADALIADLVKYQNMLDPESREYARVLSVKSYLTLAKGEAIIEAEGK